MRTIQNMLAEMSPNGVAYILLQECVTIKNGSDYKANGDGDIPVYGSGGIIAYTNRFAYNKPSVLIPRKGSIDKLYYVETPFWNVDTVFYTIIDETKILPRFLFHFLSKEHLEKYNTAGGVPSLTQKILNKIKVPVPPLAIQAEIVRILDNFTELTVKLTAELTARRLQFSYYLDSLLNNESNGANNVKLCDVCSFFNGDRGKNYPKPSELVDDGIPFINAGDIDGLVDYKTCKKITREKYNSLGGAKLKKNDILYCLRGSTGKNGICTRDEGTVASSLVAIRTNKEINYKYLFYFLNSSLEHKQRIKSDTGAAQPNLSAKSVGEYCLPLPPYERQLQIVASLDSFYDMHTSFISGIPAEIEARQKQYEYYRDKLLTFPELKQ